MLPSMRRMVESVWLARRSRRSMGSIPSRRPGVVRGPKPTGDSPTLHVFTRKPGSQGTMMRRERVASQVIPLGFPSAVSASATETSRPCTR